MWNALSYSSTFYPARIDRSILIMIGTQDAPLRVAIVGAGPAGFYAAGHLFKQKNCCVEVDMIDKLPTPFGLVRCGVAPDHQKIKNVTRIYDRTAKNPGFRFFGNVEYGRHISLEDLKAHYHQIYFSTGAQVDRRLGIPGEDLGRSYSATDFVAWYNGHPEYRHLEFDLSKRCVAVVGVGNVAVDVCRILCRTMEELAKTDIADYALEALRESKIREVYMLGRRGPAQAAFTNPEAKELGVLPGADIHVPPEEAVVDDCTKEALKDGVDRLTAKKLAIIQDFSTRSRTDKKKLLTIRFLVSPVQLHDDGTGKVRGIRLVKNELFPVGGGKLRPRATGVYEELPAEVVFRSVGYRGVALPGIPFNDSWGIVHNDGGRVVDPQTKTTVPGIYVGGWIKRGPTGVIGTNKGDAQKSVVAMMGDLRSKVCLNPGAPSAEAAERMIRARQPDAVSWQEWQRIDTIEVARGKASGRPRVKMIDTQEILSALGRA